MTLLDRPIWSSLTTHHERFSRGGDLARRFLPDVNKFVCGVDDGDPYSRWPDRDF